LKKGKKTEEIELKRRGGRGEEKLLGEEK
jgi:hypothetical protein